MPITATKTIDAYYQALLDRNSEYVGIFFAGVKTTSIFCLPTCRARKPKKENVDFFTSFKEALDHGFRPCKICKPTENAEEAPPQVEKAIALVKQNPKEKISDQVLRQEGISPETIRRWFKKHYGLTFHAYQRMYRINEAYRELKEGKNTTHTAFDNGYESLSGFGYTYKKIIGKAPSQSAEKSIILISRTTTPLGPMFICATEKGICLTEFTDRKMLETEFRDLQHRLHAEILVGENDHIRQAKQELQEYFEGKRQEFSLELDAPGTDFQKAVWDALLQVPFGETRSYQGQAEILGNPKAVRAVARANGMNRIAIIIPCHRIIGKNGKLTGYAGGLERKKWLLDHESSHKSA
ncbi:MAG: methylated-DNA--[protein]-cysteine S-methyltransferase [Bacteroidia bacterium]|nr:methylated-DNA--[protein]-cysteine S-methyltransferase [Bacteroidia bacterium]